jgi:aminoglycoside phosphotransferase (APT) family kinase protein
MAEVWTPVHPVDRELAARLIARQFPELAPLTLERVGAGWDNDLWRVSDELVFRFPRRPLAMELLERELDTLPHLGDRLPLAVPRPLLFGRAAPEYPATFVGYSYLRGTPGEGAELSEVERKAIAGPLGGFLRALHGIDPKEASGWGELHDRFQRSHVARLCRIAADRLGEFEATTPRARLARLRARLAHPPPADPAAGRCLVHGDLYARHLIFAHDRSLSGVIDWGDVHLGDPAVDLSVAFTFLPPAARSTFFEAYGEVDPRSLERARAWGLAHTVSLLAYAIDVGDGATEREARRALDFSLGPEGD